jgi:hypothetical protein
MIVVHFTKSYVQAVARAIKEGKPIPPPEGPGWTGQAMLTVAGALSACIFSQGPHTHQVAGITEAMRRKMPPEPQEAIEETLFRDIVHGIQFLMHMFFAVVEDEFDHQFEPEVKALVYENPEGEKCLVPAQGFKGRDNLFGKKK